MIRPNRRKIIAFGLAHATFWVATDTRPHQRQETRVMKIKTLLAALVLTAAPALAYAGCTGQSHQATMSCADGLAWDAATQTCVATTTS